jgi:DNA-binding transcriptional regulator YhcF (GntR family)
MVDDAYLNGYAKHLGPTASMIYLSLCRHTDKNQRSYPAQKLMAEELGINERTVMRKITVLKKWNLIKVKKIRSGKGEWLNNTYYLLDKTEWKQPPTQKIHMDTTYIKSTSPCVEKMYIKETHQKETHNTEVDEFLDKVVKWAYNRANGTPSIPQDVYKKSVLKAIERDGLDFVNKLFLDEDNAIHFLIAIK